MKADENNEKKITELQKRNLLKYQHVWIFSARLHRTKTNKYYISDLLLADRYTKRSDLRVLGADQSSNFNQIVWNQNSWGLFGGASPC